MNTNQIGTVSEMKVAAELVSIGSVCIPLDDPPYDLILDQSGNSYRIQVKSNRDQTSRNELRRGRDRYEKEYKASDFDILAIYSHEFDKVAYYPWTEETSRLTIKVWFDLSTEDSIDYVSKRQNIADDMSVESAIEKLK